MEELKLLIESIAGLPDLAIWVVGMYFFFKLMIVGSIFGVVRLITLKVWDWAKTKKESKLVTIETTRDVIELKQMNFTNECITDVEPDVVKLFKEMIVFMQKDGYSNSYVHKSDIMKLRRFWDKYLAEQEKPEK